MLAVYVFASLFGWLQARILNGIVQRAMDRLRMQVEDKIHRLPLRTSTACSAVSCSAG